MGLLLLTSMPSFADIVCKDISGRSDAVITLVPIANETRQYTVVFSQAIPFQFEHQYVAYASYSGCTWNFSDTLNVTDAKFFHMAAPQDGNFEVATDPSQSLFNNPTLSSPAIQCTGDFPILL